MRNFMGGYIDEARAALSEPASQHELRIKAMGEVVEQARIVTNQHLVKKYVHTCNDFMGPCDLCGTIEKLKQKLDALAGGEKEESNGR